MNATETKVNSSIDTGLIDSNFDYLYSLINAKNECEIFWFWTVFLTKQFTFEKITEKRSNCW